MKSQRKLPEDILHELDGKPKRAHASINVRPDEKQLFDHMHTWWELEAGHDIAQPDAFRIVLEAALENGRLNVPPHLRTKPQAERLGLRRGA